MSSVAALGFAERCNRKEIRRGGRKCGEPAMLIHHPWEAQQAAATGLARVSSEGWGRRAIVREFPDRLEAAVELRRRIFQDLGVGVRHSPQRAQLQPAHPAGAALARVRNRRRVRERHHLAVTLR